MPMPRYLLADWDPAQGRSMEEWARELADAGWRTWSGPGGWTRVNGRRIWRVSLRLDGPIGDGIGDIPPESPPSPDPS